MNKARIVGMMMGLLITLSAAFAIEETEHFATPAQQALFSDLTQSLRCLVCQNETLADSQSALAKDLRLQVAAQVKQGESRQAILQFLTTRYGDFILYSPPWQKNTYLLWLFPFVLLCLGVGILWCLLRQRRGQK